MVGLENPLHLAILLAVLLLVFGAKRLPEIGRSLGSGLRGFKDAIGGDPHPETMESLTVSSERAHEPVEAARPTSAA